MKAARLFCSLLLLFAVTSAADAAVPARGFLGLEFGDMTQAAALRTPLRKTRGALIVDVVPDSPADHAGIKTGDVVTGIDGAPITLTREASDMVKAHKPGDRITLTLFDVADGDIHPHEIQIEFTTEPVKPRILSVKPPRTLAKEFFYPPSMAANAAWSKAIALGTVKPLALIALRGGACSGFAPEDWTVRDSGARLLHLVSPDNTEHAIFKIVTLAPGDAGDPRRVARMLVSDIFRSPARAGLSTALPYGFEIFHFGMANGGSGIAIYHPDGALTLSVWIAAVPASDAAWAQPLTAATVLSIRCVPPKALPPQPRPPGLPATVISVRCGEGVCSESDFAGAYLHTLHLGYAHSPDGKAFLVRPRHDLWQTGPDGPGFYRQLGGTDEKLLPGRAN